MDDIVKQIVLKFKGDSSDLKKTTKEVQQALESLGKKPGGAGAGQSVDKLVKSFEMFNKQADKFGVKMSKDFTKLSQIIKDIAVKDLQRVGQQTDVLAQKAERRLKRLQDIESRGITGTRLERARVLASRTSERLESSMGDFAQRAQSVSGGAGGGKKSFIENLSENFANSSDFKKLGRTGTALGLIAGLAQLTATVSDMSIDWRRSNMQNVVATAAPQVRRRTRLLEGDLTESILQRNYQSITKAKEYADKQTSSKDWSIGAKGALGALGVLGATLTTGPAGGIAATAALAAMGGDYNPFSAAKYFFGGGREAEKTKSFEAKMAADKETTIDPYLYERFRRTARPRYHFLRQMGMGTDEGMDFRKSAYDQGFLAEDYENIAMQSRTRLGAIGARQLAKQSGALALSQGLDIGTSASLLTTATTRGIGGASQAEESLKKVMVYAFTQGLKDPGYLEKMQTVLQSAAEQAVSPVDISRMAQNIFQGMDMTRMTARDIEGAVGARKVEEQLTEGTPVGSYLKQSYVLDMLRRNRIDVGSPEGMALRSKLMKKNIDELDPESLKNDPTLQAFGLKEFGDTNIFRKVQEQRLNMIAPGYVDKIEKDVKSKKLTEEEANRRIGAMFAELTGEKVSPESDLQLGRKFRKGRLEDIVVTPGLEESARTHLGFTKTKAEEQQIKAESKGMTEAEDLTKRQITDRMESISAINEEQRGALRTGRVGENIADSAEELKNALDSFVRSVERQTGSSSYGQAGSQ